MYPQQQNNFPSNRNDSAHFSAQVNLGREIQETLQLLRKSFIFDPSGGLYKTIIENLEINLSPYIVNDTLKEGTRSYQHKMGRYLFQIATHLRTKLNQLGMSNEDAMQIILKDPYYSEKYAQKKHAEIMLLLARNGLLPVPLGPDFVDMNIQFEKFDPAIHNATVHTPTKTAPLTTA